MEITLATFRFLTLMEKVNLHERVQAIECRFHQLRNLSTPPNGLVIIIVTLRLDEKIHSGSVVTNRLIKFEFTFGPTSHLMVQLMSAVGEDISHTLNHATEFGESMYAILVENLVTVHEKRSGPWQSMYIAYQAQKRKVAAAKKRCAVRTKKKK